MKMSSTPPDFPIPSFDEDNTGQVVHVRDVVPIAKATMHLIKLETKRSGQLSVIMYLLGFMILFGGAFLAWITKEIISIESGMSAVAQHVTDMDRHHE